MSTTSNGVDIVPNYIDTLTSSGNNLQIGGSSAVPAYVDYYPWQSYPSSGYYGWIAWPTEPTHCIGKAHVFECEHVTACKCGAIKRVMPRTRRATKK